MTTSVNPNPGRRRTQTRGFDVLPSGRCRIRLSGFPSEIVADELAAQLRR